VILEKIAGLAFVKNLRAILLMELDFKFYNRLIFGNRMLTAAIKNGLIPPKQYSKQQITTEDGSFERVLQGNISHQRRLSM